MYCLVIHHLSVVRPYLHPSPAHHPLRMTYFLRRVLPRSILAEVTRSLEAVEREICKGEISKLEKPEHRQEEGKPVPGSPAALLIDVGAIGNLVVVALDRPEAKPGEEGTSGSGSGSGSGHLGRRRGWRDKHQSQPQSTETRITAETRIESVFGWVARWVDGNTAPQAENSADWEIGRLASVKSHQSLFSQPLLLGRHSGLDRAANHCAICVVDSEWSLAVFRQGRGLCPLAAAKSHANLPGKCR